MKKIILSFFLLISVFGFGQNIPARPVPPRLVNDFADILTNSQEQALERKLVNYNDTTSTQICIVTINDLDGTSAWDFAYQIGEKWGVGHKENNGAVILVKPKKGNEKGAVAIQVGYGLEPYVTDAMSKRIINTVMIPAFKDNHYYEGIDKACNAIINLASGAYSSDKRGYTDDDSAAIVMVVLILIFIIVVIALLGKGNSGGTMSSKGGSDLWKILFWSSMLSRHSGSSSWGGFSGGSGGFGGGGGFGGFGGGHFGGGGASGSW